MAIFKKDIFLVSHIRANCKAHVNTNGLFSSHKIAIFGMYLTPPVKGFASTNLPKMINDNLPNWFSIQSDDYNYFLSKQLK